MRQLTELEQSRLWKFVRLTDGRQAVLLDYPSVKDTRDPDEVNRNLLCVNGDQVVWQANPPPPFQPSGDPFVSVENTEGVLKATRFFGDICEVDVTTGDAKIVGWTK